MFKRKTKRSVQLLEMIYHNERETNRLLYDVMGRLSNLQLRSNLEQNSKNVERLVMVHEMECKALRNEINYLKEIMRSNGWVDDRLVSQTKKHLYEQGHGL